MAEIRIPRLNANDDEYTLIEWLHDDGVFVAAGEPFAVVETSKATEELEMPEAGHLRHAATALQQYRIGAVIAHRFDAEDDAHRHRLADEQHQEAATYVLTDEAQALADRHAVAPPRIAALHRRIVRAEDIRALIADQPTAAAPAGTDDHQDAVAAVVTRSHREIPTAYAVIRVGLDTAEQVRAAVAQHTGTVIGVAELVIAAVGRAAPAYPRLYAPYGQQPDLHAGVDVGVTTDLGHGLFLPVIPAGAGHELPDIAARLLEVRRKALRRSFTARDLGDGGHIAVSLNTDADIVLAVPIVFPQHCCMVAVGATLTELVLDDAGGVRARDYLHLGLSYDHRVVNGREAMAFLRHVKDLLEQGPEQLPATAAGLA